MGQKRGITDNMTLSRRDILKATAIAGGAVFANRIGLFGSDARAAEPTSPPLSLNDRRPLPELVDRKDLPVFDLDVEKSSSKHTLILKDGNKFNTQPQGCVVRVPAGAEIPLYGWKWRIKKKNHGYVPGARLILSGAAEGPRPVLTTVDPSSIGKEKPSGLLYAGNSAGFDFPVGFEVENINLNGNHFEGGGRTEAIRTDNIRFVRISDCLVEGGRNGAFFSPNPTIAFLERTEVKHGGTGDGLTHCIYCTYIEAFVARDCKFHSARPFGVPLKCYAQYVDVRDSVIASWLDYDDLDNGWTSGYPPLDIGAWATTIIANNRLVRRGPPIRQTLLEYRNRQWPARDNRFMKPGWGTKVIPYDQADNRDPENPHLFRHLLAYNRFENGILPDGSIDTYVKQKPGIAVRNNGAGTWASQGGGPVDKTPKNRNWRKHNERAVVWSVGNQFDGVPFNELYERSPYKRPDDFGPIIASESLPEWAQGIDLRNL